MFTRSQASRQRHRSQSPRTPSPEFISPQFTPGTPGPNEQSHLYRVRARAYPPASPATGQQAAQLRRRLFQLLPGTPGHTFQSPTPPRPQLPYLVYRPTCNTQDMPGGSAPPSASTSPARNPNQAEYLRQERHLQQLLCTTNQPASQTQDQRPGVTEQQQTQETTPPGDLPRDPPDVQDQLTQMTQVLQNLVNIQRQRPAASPTRQEEQQPQQTAPPLVEDINFDWSRLATPTTHAFPSASVAKIQQLATAMFIKAPLLTGRDRHETDFVLSLLSLWPQLPDQARQSLFQRLNLLYIATHYGWGIAIDTTQASTQHLAVFPPGYTLPTTQPRTAQQTYYADPPQPRGRPFQRRGNRARGRPQLPKP